VGGGLDGNIDPGVCTHIFSSVFSKLKFLLVMEILQILSKLLISKCFGRHPKKLWITLWRTEARWPESLENQAFRWNAHAMGNLKKLFKINDLEIRV
jgi:hypothetical protein